MKTKKNIFVEGNVVDIIGRKIYPARVIIQSGIIERIEPRKNVPQQYILPGLVDAHVHIESSMLTPGRFAEMAVRCGTVAVVADPHEIANIMGMEGIKFMIDEGKRVPLAFYFGAPPCVPATPFETTGSVINVKDIENLIGSKDIYFLAEMMNYPGVINEEKEIMEKINLAKKKKKKIDGHAPGLTGKNLIKYIKAGITTDHECSNIYEAKEKIEQGMKVLIREGSAAKNLDELIELVDKYPNNIMFCTDDIHPDDLKKGHINRVIKRGREKGADLFNLIAAATVNPQKHYGIKQSSLQEHESADLIVVKNLDSFEVIKTIICGNVVFENGKVLFSSKSHLTPNKFIQNHLSQEDLVVFAGKGEMKVIVAKDNELMTGMERIKPKLNGNIVLTDPDNDLLKICVLNRYKKSTPAIGFIRGIGISHGAIASSIAHDSHNIIGVGTTDEELTRAINHISEMKGGIVVVRGEKIEYIDLPVGGIMTNEEGLTVAAKYETLSNLAKKLGSPLKAPFMTLSFMALLVIPELKISDKGLFDVKQFQPVKLFDN